MFQKTHSNNPSEIKKDIGTLYQKVRKSLNLMMVRYPRQSFGIMVATLILSALLALYIPPFTQPKLQEDIRLLDEVNNLGSGMADEVSALYKIGRGAKKVGQLKEEVERIIAKEKISLEDSIFLENAILQLQQFHESNPGNHED
ncbi:hypothetical protein [Lunatibacter salilacus]|uniref:hypothetical protein n=1 Tax=Lunatibacter salilacus TaxID=2483804 RepID=UPI00131C926B|nr:hypothetical protein [Lunatibacter salilacus]